MGSNIAKPMPADFPIVAINMSQSEAAEHFNLSVWQVIRMMREQTPEWRAEYRKGWRVRTRAAALANAEKALAAFMAKHPKGDKKVNPGPFVRRPMPDGFLVFMLSNSADAACKEYKTSEATIKRWKSELSQSDRDAIAANAKARKTAHIQAMTAIRKANSPPPAPKPKRSPRVRGFGFNKLPELSTAKGGQAETAAQHLRRLRYIPVCRGETVNEALKGMWLVGRLPAMPEDDMIALAVSKGCDFDSWRRLAA